MSTRVQKGSTIFRPVAKSRPRTAATENTSTQPSLVSQDTSPPGTRETLPSVAPEDVPVIALPSTALRQVSFQGNIDHVVADVPKQGVPITVSTPTPITQPAKSRAPPAIEETAPCSGSQVSVVERPSPHQSRRRSRSESLATVSSKKNRKVRQPATPAFNARADPGEELDPTSVTMAALCDDTGHGRVSSKAAQVLDNHLTWRKTVREKRAKMRSRMEAKKYGRNEDGDTAQGGCQEDEPEQNTPADATSASLQPISGNPPAVGDVSGQGFDYSKNVSTSRYNVQVRIGPNGETVVDEESLFVDRNAEEDTIDYTHVEESDVTKFVNSATYSKRFRGSRWSAEETELFYDALSQFGENYELISYLLPGRDRKACKNKFKSEDKKNSERINYCLKNRKPYDMQTLSRMTGKDFSGPTPEIRAPVVLSLGELRNNPENDQTLVRKRTMMPIEEEVVGDVSSFDPE